MTQEARCVIIGGGAMGVGLLYYLAHEGWTDTVLLEKGELTSGSTWHAAGLIPNFIGDLNMAKVHQEAIALYPRIEAETGLSAGWHGCGAIRLARTDDEVDWHRYVHAMLTQIGIESDLIGLEEIRERHPLLEDLSDVKLGFYTPNDGWTDPSGCTNAMARGARNLGCEIRRHTLVSDMNQLPDGRWEVIATPNGAGPRGSNGDDSYRIVCEHVVNAAGHYAPQLGAMVGLDVPVVSVIHQYLVTEPLQAMIDLGFEPPVVRDPRASCYYRREIDGLLIGPYEMSGSRTYGIDGIDWKLHFHLTGENHDVLEECIEYAAMRIPAFMEAGIKQTVSGPITHTPDSGYLMGPAPGLGNYWHCSGASIGITQGPGAGKYLAQWMVHGQTEINVRSMDPRRFGDHTGPKSQFALDKAHDEYHEMYQVRLPGEYRAAGRPQKTSPIYDRLDRLGAQWQEVYGWERPQYFSPNGAGERHSFRRSNAFEVVAAEVRGVRERVGIADITAFASYEVAGADAAVLLDHRQRYSCSPPVGQRRRPRAALVPPVQRFRGGGRRGAGRARAGGDRRHHRLRVLRGGRRRRGRPARPPVGQPAAGPRRRHPAGAHAHRDRRHRVRDDHRAPRSRPLLPHLRHHGPEPRPRLADPARAQRRGRDPARHSLDLPGFA